MHPDSPDISHIVAYYTELVHENERLFHLAYHDSLTGLYNKAYFDRMIHNSEPHFPISMIICDINGLKLINDIYGKEIGDQAIRTVSKIILESTRKTDIAFRFGGDDFCIYLPNTDKKIVHTISNTIREKTNTIKSDDLPDSLLLTISVGFTTQSSKKESINDIFREAETLMNRYKLLETRSMRSSTVSLVLHTLQEKNIETNDHFDRMKKHCLAIGQYMKLSNSMLTDLELLAVLHDIGKISISDAIINKNAKLTRPEKEEIKKHSEYGYKITQSTVEFQHLSDYILAHHEKWDGTGYPNKLKGNDIPLLSRIIALVDSFDAMTNVRPYREALSVDYAMTEIKHCSGTQFDPQIARIFIENILNKPW